MKLIHVSAQILQANTFCILGTADNYEPWVTPVAYKLDDQCNFYWTSRRDTKHSEFILNNPKTTICVLDQHEIAPVTYPDGRSHPRALYFSGQAREISIDELEELIKWRYPGNQKPVADFGLDKPSAIYQFVTSAAWCLDDPEVAVIINDQRLEINLKELRHQWQSLSD